MSTYLDEIGLYPHQRDILKNLDEVMFDRHILFKNSLDSLENAQGFHQVMLNDPAVAESVRLLQSLGSLQPRELEFALSKHPEPLESVFNIPDRSSIPSRSGLFGELTYAECILPKPKPALDLAECTSKSFPISDVQLMLEGNSILAEFHEETYEQSSFRDWMDIPNAIDNLTSELDAITFEDFHAKVDGLPQNVLEDRNMRVAHTTELDRRRHSDSIRKRSKQKGKRK